MPERVLFCPLTGDFRFNVPAPKAGAKELMQEAIANLIDLCLSGRTAAIVADFLGRRRLSRQGFEEDKLFEFAKRFALLKTLSLSSKCLCYDLSVVYIAPAGPYAAYFKGAQFIQCNTTGPIYCSGCATFGAIVAQKLWQTCQETGAGQLAGQQRLWGWQIK